MARYPSFVGPSNTAQSPIADQERVVNFYVERTTLPGEKAQSVLYPTPGLSQVGEVTTSSPGRGAFSAAGRCFLVIGATFCEINEAYSVTEWGTVAVNDNPVTMCYNGDGGEQVFITSGNNGYIFNTGANTLTQVRTGATTMGAFIDGYFLALDAATSTLWLSDLLDGTVWDGTQFTQRSAAADPWVSLIVNYQDIWLIGTKTTDVWYDAGTFPFPLAPRPNSTIPHGTNAPWSVKVVAGSVQWLSQNQNGGGTVVSASGYTPQLISTPALQVALESYQNTSDAIGDTFEMLGHAFYVLTFPSASATWLFDTQSGLWTEMGTWVSEANDYEAWRGLFHVYTFGQHLILDRESGAIYTLSHENGLDADGRPLRRLRRAPGVFSENRRIFYPRFELFLQPGVGVQSGQGSDPQVMLRTSNDGGQTWSTERDRSVGKVGQYGTRVYWTRCGSARDRVFEVSMSDPVPYRIIDAYLTVEQGAEF